MDQNSCFHERKEEYYHIEFRRYGTRRFMVVMDLPANWSRRDLGKLDPCQRPGAFY